MTYIKSHNVYHFSNLHCLHSFNNVFHLRKRERVILSLVATRTDVTKCVQDNLSNVSHLPAVDQRIERRIQIHNGQSKKPYKWDKKAFLPWIIVARPAQAIGK